MAIWTLITTLGNGSGGRTNGFPNDWLYPGTFTHVGSSGTNKVYAVANLNKPENDPTGASWVLGLPNVIAPGFIANTNTIPLDNPINCCVPIVTAPLVVPAPVMPNVTINATANTFSTEGVRGCADGIPFTQWIQKDGNGQPTGIQFYTDDEGDPVAAPANFIIGECGGNSNRVFISTQLLNLTIATSTLTVPPTANWAEIYITGGDITWSYTNVVTQGVSALNGGTLEIESRSELLAFNVTAITTANLLINYFTV